MPVNHYVADCKAAGRIPQKPYSGSLMLRFSPETHARIAAQAAMHGKGIDAWAAKVLERGTEALPAARSRPGR